MKRLVTTLIAVFAISFAGASAALANSLHQSTPITGPGTYAEVGCDEGWHFVHTGTSSADLPSTITVTFSGAGEVVVAGHVNGNSIVMYDVLVDPTDTLLSASDSITNDGLLNLSHICVAETPSEQPSTAPSEQPSEQPSEAPSQPVATPTPPTATETPSEDTGVGGDEPTPPSTDTLSAVAPTSDVGVPVALLLLAAGVLGGVATARRVRRVQR